MTHPPKSPALIARLLRAYHARLFPYNPYINKRALIEDRARRTGGFAARRRVPSAPSPALAISAPGLQQEFSRRSSDGREADLADQTFVRSGDRCGAAHHGKSARQLDHLFNQERELGADRG